MRTWGGPGPGLGNYYIEFSLDLCHIFNGHVAMWVERFTRESIVYNYLIFMQHYLI